MASLWFFGKILTLLCRTLRIDARNAAPLLTRLERNMPCLVLFWHGKMLVPWWWLRGGKASALISRSKDGEILATLLRMWGYGLVRGSSSTGGREAMNEMVEKLRSGVSFCVTPDGPRGPRMEMKMGAVRAAQKSGVPIFLVAVTTSWKKRLRSWDGFEIPLPFSRCLLSCSEPISVENDVSMPDLEPLRADLENRLREMQRSDGGE